MRLRGHLRTLRNCDLRRPKYRLLQALIEEFDEHVLVMRRENKILLPLKYSLHY